MKITASSDAIEDIMMLPAASSAGQPGSFSREGAGNPKGDRAGGNFVLAKGVGPTAAAHAS
eukprot:5469353-Pyramimonas_sp.AAC.1